MLVVVCVPEFDVADAFESKGAERTEADAERIADEFARCVGDDDLLGRTGGLGAGRCIDVGAVPTIFEIFRRPDVNADAELEGA